MVDSRIAAMREKHASYRWRFAVSGRAGHYYGAGGNQKESRSSGADLRQQRSSSPGCSARKQGGSERNEYCLVGAQGCARRSVTAVLQGTSLYFPEWWYRFLPSCRVRQAAL